MAKGFFITGTDTGVGKTIITAALIKAVSLLGFRTCGMKPVETGCLKQKSKVNNSESGFRYANLLPPDGIFLKEIAGMEDSMDLVTPVRLESPLAPLPAADIEGVQVNLEEIFRAYSELSRRYDVIIVEGAGGLLVPVRKDYFILNLAIDFGLPLIVVSRRGLGTINHTMLTVNYAMKEGLTVAGIILNHSLPPEGTLAEGTNPNVIEKISPVPIIGTFPYLKELERSNIEKAGIKSLNLEIIKKYL